MIYTELKTEIIDNTKRLINMRKIKKDKEDLKKIQIELILCYYLKSVAKYCKNRHFMI